MRRALALLLVLSSACATTRVRPEGEEPPLTFLRDLDSGEVHTELTDAMKGVLPMGLEQFGRDWKTSHGALVSARVVSRTENSWDVDAIYEASPFSERFTLVFDADGKLAGLWFRGAGSGAMAADELRTALAQLPGQVSAFVQAAEHREVRLGYRETEPQSVASQYKTLLLARACAELGRGERHLEDRLALPGDVRGTPSCVLCNFDPGLQPTLRDVLHLLVSASDNTAADLLRQVLGVDAVTRFAQQWGVEHAPPLISTQGLFASECGLGPLRDVPADQRAKVLAAMSPDERIAATDAAARDGYADGPDGLGARCDSAHPTADSEKAIAHVIDWPMRTDELVALYENAQLGQLDSAEASRCFVDFMGHGGAGPIPLGDGYQSAGTKNGIEQDVRSVGVVVQTDRGPVAVSVSAIAFPDADADKELGHLYEAAHALVNWAYLQLPAR